MSKIKITSMTLTRAQKARKNALPQITMDKLRDLGACWINDCECENCMLKTTSTDRLLAKITQDGKIKSLSLIDVLELPSNLVSFADKQWLLEQCERSNLELPEAFIRHLCADLASKSIGSEIANKTLRELLLLDGYTVDELADMLENIDSPSFDDVLDNLIYKNESEEQTVKTMTKYMRDWILKG